MLVLPTGSPASARKLSLSLYDLHLGANQMAQSVMQSCRIYIIGAQCTGKTTLIEHLEAHFRGDENEDSGCEKKTPKPIIIQEVARTVLREKNFNRDDIRNSPLKALQLQHHILEAQLKAERAAACKSGDSLPFNICDRSGLDPIVYTHIFVGKKEANDILMSKAWLELEDNMKAGVVILCEAGCSWLVDDGTRLMPNNLDDWMLVDSTFRKLLAVRGIDYIVCPKDLVRPIDRLQLVLESIQNHTSQSLPAV